MSLAEKALEQFKNDRARWIELAEWLETGRGRSYENNVDVSADRAAHYRAYAAELDPLIEEAEEELAAQP